MLTFDLFTVAKLLSKVHECVVISELEHSEWTRLGTKSTSDLPCGVVYSPCVCHSQAPPASALHYVSSYSILYTSCSKKKTDTGMLVHNC